MENCHDNRSKQTTKMPCFLFIIHRCLIPFSVHTVGYDKKNQYIKYITVCCNLGETCAYSPVYLCWKGWCSTWKLTTPVCSITFYFSQKQKNDTYIAIACVIEHEFLFNNILYFPNQSHIYGSLHILSTQRWTLFDKMSNLPLPTCTYN